MSKNTTIVFKTENTDPPGKINALLLLAMLYVTIMLITVSMAYKIISIFSIPIVASTLVLPLWLILGDVITEVYGYSTARNMIWIGLACEFFYIFTCVALVHAPSPSFWNHQSSYDYVFGNLPRVFLGSVLGIFAGGFLNAYIVSKGKILMRGKYFWLRSLISSAIGEAIFTVIVIICNYLGAYSWQHLFQLMLVSYLFKLFTTSISTAPASLLCYYLKKIEGIDFYDTRVNFNPFVLRDKTSREKL